MVDIKISNKNDENKRDDHSSNIERLNFIKKV